LLLLLLLLLLLSRSRRLRDAGDHLGHLRRRNLSHGQRGRGDGLGQLRGQRSGSAEKRPRRRGCRCSWRRGTGGNSTTARGRTSAVIGCRDAG
jgi:hypothetical protein